MDPTQSGAYEWWYFDAISDDGRFVLVAIYFLGSPMTPYYKAVVDGKNPDPRDWCGVFLSLHEKTCTGFRERAYAYNVYRGGDFSPDTTQVRIDNSFLASDGDGAFWKWHLNAREKCLWVGDIRLDATFTALGSSLNLPPIGDIEDASHSWVCVAPVCRAEVRFRLSNGSEISFSGHGYHDHNFGQLPWEDVDVWYWGRARLKNKYNEHCNAVYYRVDSTSGSRNATAIIGDENGNIVYGETELVSEPDMPAVWKNQYGFSGLACPVVMTYSSEAWRLPLRILLCGWINNINSARVTEPLGNGPFYLRSRPEFFLQAAITRKVVTEYTGSGIGEVFRPARLCGPIASRAMWTRIRRRS